MPIELADTPADVTFDDVPREPWEIAGVRIEAKTVSHPGPTLGFRLSSNGNAFANIPDHEPVLGVELADLEEDWISGHAIAGDVDLLFQDCQFTESEYRHAWAGGTRASRTRSSSPDGRRPVASCSSTTIQIIPTTPSTASSSGRASCGTARTGIHPSPRLRA